MIASTELSASDKPRLLRPRDESGGPGRSESYWDPQVVDGDL